MNADDHGSIDMTDSVQALFKRQQRKDTSFVITVIFIAAIIGWVVGYVIGMSLP